MAENTEESQIISEDVNPFSFSKFVTKKEEKDIPSSTIEDSKKETSEENPFSFQTFSKSTVPVSSNAEKKPKNKKLLIVDDIETIDDIFADTNLNESKLKIKSSKNKAHKNKPSFQTALPNDLDNTDVANVHSLSASEEEDDLSASPQVDTYLLTDPNHEASNETELWGKLQMLKQENEDLRRDLSAIKKEHKEYKENAAEKVKSLSSELQKARRKEAEDTQALEDAVRLVENNLQATTERALKAEQKVSKLQDELKLLKESQISTDDWKTLQADHSHLLNTIQEKSRHAAHLMRTAVSKSEPQLKQLQSGIDILKLLAEQFDGIGKIAEMPKDNHR